MNQIESPRSLDTTTPSRGRKGLIAGVGAGLLGGAAAGLLFAVPGSSSAAVDDTATGDVVAAVAQVDETSPDGSAESADRLADRTERLRAALDELVGAGTITSEQADAVASHLAEQAPDRGTRGPRGGHGPGRFLDGSVLQLLDIDAETLRTELSGGATLAEVAEANGVSVDALVDTMVADAMQRLDQAVENGRLGEAEAAEKAAELEERITERVNTNPRAGDTGDTEG